MNFVPCTVHGGSSTTFPIKWINASNGLPLIWQIQQLIGINKFTIHMFSRNVAGKMDVSWEPHRWSLHSSLRYLEFRRPPIRDDHLRQLSLPGNVQQPGAQPRQVREYPQHPAGDQTQNVSGFFVDKLKPLMDNLSCFLRSTLLQSCWSYSSSRRPTAAEIVELLFNCPRLVSPSIDVPLASVQIER